MTQWNFNNILSEIRWHSNTNEFRREILTDNSKGNFKGVIFLLFKMASK